MKFRMNGEFELTSREFMAVRDELESWNKLISELQTHDDVNEPKHDGLAKGVQRVLREEKWREYRNY